MVLPACGEPARDGSPQRRGPIGRGLGWVGSAAWCRSRPSGVGVLPCPTTRLNNLNVRFQGRADYRQPPDPTEALVGGRYRRPMCRRARGLGLGWAVGCGACGARRPGCSQRMSGHTDLPRLAHMPWAPGLRVFGLTLPPSPVCFSRGGAFPGGGGGCSRGGSSGVLSGRQSGGTHIVGTTRRMPLIYCREFTLWAADRRARAKRAVPQG